MKSRNTLLELCRPAASRGWRIEAYVRAIAGAMVLASVVLAVLVSQWWLLLTLFVGVNLLQSALSGWCLMSNLLGLVFSQGERVEAPRA